MAVFMTKDKKELIVTCNCGCKSSVNIQIDEMEDIGYAFLCFLKGNFYYCYSDTIMTKEDFEEFKRYINQF